MRNYWMSSDFCRTVYSLMKYIVELNFNWFGPHPLLALVYLGMWFNHVPLESLVTSRTVY